MKLIRKFDKGFIQEDFYENVFGLFQINLENWFETEFILCHKGGLSITEIDNMEFYRVQYYIKNYSEYLEKEKQQQEGDNKRDIFNHRELMREVKNIQKDGLKTTKTSSGFGNLNIPKIPKI